MVAYNNKMLHITILNQILTKPQIGDSHGNRSKGLRRIGA